MDQDEFVISTTLVVMPPKDSWPQFVDIKKNHMNPKISRPPYPHITMLSPFVKPSAFEATRTLLANALKDVKPFKLTFKTFAIFENKGSSTLFLKPDVSPPTALDSLQRRIAALYPQQKKSNFVAHIAVGNFPSATEAKQKQAEYQKGWTPIEFICKEIYINSWIEKSQPFEVRVVIPLGGDTTDAHFKEVPL